MTAESTALQRALAAEHAAIWGYGEVGGHLPRPEQPAALAADAAHRARRDRVTAVLEAGGATPVVAAPAYVLPFPVPGAPAARRLAVHLEEGTAAAWHAVLDAALDVQVRQLALAGLTDAAARGLQWRLIVPGEPSTVPFPGT